jgi:hypothetical protein
MQFWYKTLSGRGGEYAARQTVDIPSTDVLVFCSLQQFKGDSPTPQAQMCISQYVANDELHEGSWQTINANKVTSVTFTLVVKDAEAQGLGLILATNE